MADLNVDLLSGKARGIARTNRIVKWQKKAVWIILGLFLVISFGVFAWWGFEVNRKSKIEKRQRRLLAELEDRSDLQGRYMLTKEVLFQADQILGVRKDFEGVLSDAYSLLPPGSVARGINFGDNNVSLQVSNDGVQEYASLIRNLEVVEDHDRFQSATVVSSTRLRDGSWTANLVFNFKKAL